MAGHYVDKVLQEGERVRYIASLNWILYVPGLLLWFVAAVIYFASPDSGGLGTIGRLAALIVFAAGLVVLARAWFRWWTTEIAVTDRRIIYKTGFISRKTTEMHMDKVESVDVDQSVLGRIFNFGNVIVRGTGSGLEPIRDIDAPLELRNHITGV
jgi:uncharacterized membrane protein YdbT with pleckstrin-like domain